MKQTSNHKDLRKLKHLAATINNFLPRGRGNCFQRSVAMVMDVPTTKLVIGTLGEGEGHLHAWVEDRGAFYEPSRFEEDGGLLRLQRDDYLDREIARDIHIVARKPILDFARRGSLSRWMLSTDDTYHSLGGIMGEVLLDELGLQYTVGESRFLYPKR